MLASTITRASAASIWNVVGRIGEKDTWAAAATGVPRVKPAPLLTNPPLDAPCADALEQNAAILSPIPRRNGHGMRF
jgi:hypothetical protein